MFCVQSADQLAFVEPKYVIALIWIKFSEDLKVNAVETGTGFVEMYLNDGHQTS